MSWQQALRENLRLKESEEKQRRARAAKEKAEREKLERQQKKRRLLEVNTGTFQSALAIVYHTNGIRNVLENFFKSFVDLAQIARPVSAQCEIKNNLWMERVYLFLFWKSGGMLVRVSENQRMLKFKSHVLPSKTKVPHVQLTIL